MLHDPGLNEEQGGFILKRPNTQEYQFIPITNQNTGTATAVSLYTADTKEFNDFVALPAVDEGFEIFASFHSHPNGMRAIPSQIDLTQLFTSFPVNFIFAYGMELNRYDYDSKAHLFMLGDEWRYTNVITFNGYNPSRKAAKWFESENI